VATAQLTTSGEVLPSAHRVEVLTDIRALVEYRDQLVRARTQVANRAHADLVNIRPGYGKEVPNLRAKVHRGKARSLLRGDHSVRAELLRSRLGELLRLEGEIAAMDRRIGALVRETGTSLTAIPGVGPFIAAKILGEVGDPPAEGGPGGPVRSPPRPHRGRHPGPPGVPRRDHRRAVEGDRGGDRPFRA
jgi:transposase